MEIGTFPKYYFFKFNALITKSRCCFFGKDDLLTSWDLDEASKLTRGIFGERDAPILAKSNIFW